MSGSNCKLDHEPKSCQSLFGGLETFAVSDSQLLGGIDRLVAAVATLENPQQTAIVAVTEEAHRKFVGHPDRCCFV